MDTSTILTIIHVIIGVLLMAFVLIQNKGVGLSQTFGGSGGGNVYRTKRGAEKILFRGTILLSVFFVGLSIAQLFLQ